MAMQMPAFRKYRLARTRRIFMGVVAPLLMTLFVGMPLHWWLEKPMPLLTALYCLLPLGLAASFLYGLAEAIWGHIVITPEGVAEVGLLRKRRLAWVEIKGYRLGKNYLRLVSANARKQAVKIGLLTEEVEKITDWVASHYPNLSPLLPTGAEVRLEPFTSPAGQTAQARQRTEAQQTARLLNRASWLATAWLVFYPTPYKLAVMAGILLPLGAVAAQGLYPGQRPMMRQRPRWA